MRMSLTANTGKSMAEIMRLGIDLTKSLSLFVAWMSESERCVVEKTLRRSEVTESRKVNETKFHAVLAVVLILQP